MLHSEVGTAYLINMQTDTENKLSVLLKCINVEMYEYTFFILRLITNIFYIFNFAFKY